MAYAAIGKIVCLSEVFVPYAWPRDYELTCDNDVVAIGHYDNDVKLPIDYEMFGKSFDGLDYRFLKPIKERFPEDYAKIKEFFPLIDLEILRYDKI